MEKLTKITLLVSLVLVIGFSVFVLRSVDRLDRSFSGQDAPYSYSDATNTSSSIPATATTTSPILSADASRSEAIVCNNGAQPVFLHQKGLSTTTGVAVNTGIYLSPIGLTTSTANVCARLPGFKGYLFGIAPAATFVTVSEWK